MENIINRPFTRKHIEKLKIVGYLIWGKKGIRSCRNSRQCKISISSELYIHVCVTLLHACIPNSNCKHTHACTHTQTHITGIRVIWSIAGLSNFQLEMEVKQWKWAVFMAFFFVNMLVNNRGIKSGRKPE